MQRVLAKPYAERDVADIELYVRDVVRQLGFMRRDERDRLVMCGIFVVRRIAQALPPEVSLAETLSGRLTEALNAYRLRTQGDLLVPSGAAPSRAA